MDYGVQMVLPRKSIAVTNPFRPRISHAQAIHNVRTKPLRLAMTAQLARMSVRIAPMHLNALTPRHALTNQHGLTVRKEQI